MNRRFLLALRFELRHQLRQPLFVAVAVVFGLLAFAAMASENVQVGGVGGNLNLNAHFTIIQTSMVFSLLGMFAATAFVGAPVVRDDDTRMAEIMLATPVDRPSYLTARFLAGYIACVLAVSAVLPGTLLGSLMPWLDPERLGPLALAPYWFSFWAVLLPNLLIPCGLIFGATAITRRLSAGWVLALTLLVFYAVVAVNTDAETVATTAVLDPFGLIAFGEQTRYWPVFDRNTLVPAIEGSLLASRLFWLSLALAAIALGHGLFRFRLANRGGGAGESRTADPAPVAGVVPQVVPQPRAWPQFQRQLRMDVRGVLVTPAFWAVLAFGVFNTLGGILASLTTAYGTPLLPSSGTLVQAIDSTFGLSLLLVVVWFSGELVHRERAHRVDELLAATPVPAWVPLLAKTLALLGVLVAMLAMAVVTAVLVQLAKGYTSLDPLVYLVGVFSGIGMDVYLLAVLAVVLQVLIGHRFLAMGMVLLVFVGFTALSSAGYDHPLYSFEAPGLPWSDMNGFGHFLWPHLVVSAYWLAFCAVLLVFGHLFAAPGRAGAWRDRLQAARGRATRPLQATLAGSLALFLALGGYIYWNTNVLNTYRDGDAEELAAVAYEQAYGQFRGLRMPDVVDMQVDVDIHPLERRLESRGHFVLRNTSTAPMAAFHYNLPEQLVVDRLAVSGTTVVAADPALGYHQLAFEPPLPPGGEARLDFALRWETPGFVVTGSSTRLVHNGTFVDITEVAPRPGYNSGRELQDNNTRREHGLPPAQRLPAFGAPGNEQLNQFRVASRTAFRTTVSTSADQIAIAPGYLQRQWREQGRAYFEYAMDTDIWPFVSWQSARYAVAKDSWNGVALEVYHHPAHHRNVEPMLRAAKRGLDWFSAAFSPYQYRQFRIQEFPNYARFAQAFPNTIPFSEDVGFSADLSDPDEIDYVFYVTAHELAHQWWAHQLIGANEQGQTVLVETLAQYSALMLMEQEYGREQMRRFLKFEGDNYLSSRGGEVLEELPLKLVEGQGYIHYRKGSLVMYALKDYLGEAAVNRALATLIAEHGNRGAPFPGSGHLIDLLLAEADTPAGQRLVRDLFEQITLWDLSVAEASAKPLGENRWAVTLTLDVAQFRADGRGAETEVPLDMAIEVGVFGAPVGPLPTNALPPPLYLAKHPLTSGRHTLVVEVAGAPDRVAVDPLNLLVDRQPGDNIKAVAGL